LSSAYLALLLELQPVTPQVVVLDDVGPLELTDLWRGLPLPKDIASFGQWSGTRLVGRESVGTAWTPTPATSTSVRSLRLLGGGHGRV
jgi:hypothetical protein